MLEDSYGITAVVMLFVFNSFFGIGYVDGVYWTLLVELKFYLLVLCVL